MFSIQTYFFPFFFFCEQVNHNLVTFDYVNLYTHRMTTDIITTTIGERFVALILPVTITIYCVVWVINNITYLFSEQPTAQKSLRRWQGVDTV